ncbi:hypothetical protein EV361DRAFT_873458 [Lentinula raphanica]|nr:hypothetical protein EV361DRAFT_873458 [Lentinula raphanica]
MNEQQWSQYGSSALQNSLQQSPPLSLSLNTDWPTENFETNESIPVISNAYNCGNSWGDQPLGWMSVSQNFNMAASNEPVDEGSKKQQIIEIQLSLALVTNASNTPGILFDAELEAEAQSITKQNGIFEISVESIVSLINRAYLPFEIADALGKTETRVATAERVPTLWYPVHLLPRFRHLAPMVDILISPPSHFRLQSVSNTGFPYFLPERESDRPKFVLILLGGLRNPALTAFRSDFQSSTSSNVLYADHSSDVTYASIPAHRPSSLSEVSVWTEIPLESQTDSFSLASNHGEANATTSETYTQVVSPVVPRSSDTQADLSQQPTVSQSVSSFEFQIPVQAINIQDACRIIGISEPQGPPIPEHKRLLSEIIQDWQRAWMLTTGLGYNEAKGTLSVQSYTWRDGNVQTFEQILAAVNWKLGPFTRKTSLYNWAINATSTKVWNTLLAVPVGQEKLIADARQTWNRLVFFFQATSFLYGGDPRSSLRNSREYDLTYLHESDVRKYKRHIKNYLTDRPEFSG